MQNQSVEECFSDSEEEDSVRVEVKDQTDFTVLKSEKDMIRILNKKYGMTS